MNITSKFASAQHGGVAGLMGLNKFNRTLHEELNTTVKKITGGYL